MSNNANNGLITKIWGPCLWTALHSITFGYPVEPTLEQKKHYKEYFIATKNVLPCKYCRESYATFITAGPTALTDDVFQSRDTLTKWLYKLHNTVNDKLKTDYKINYSDVQTRYEAYRASCSRKTGNGQNDRCVVPLHKKLNPYVINNIKDNPIISTPLAQKFISYAKIRGVSNENLHIINIYNSQQILDKQLLNKNSHLWRQRNKECENIIRTMRMNNIKSLETSGKWIGLPTVQELSLIMRLCSNLCPDELEGIVTKLPNTSPNTLYSLNK